MKYPHTDIYKTKLRWVASKNPLANGFPVVVAIPGGPGLGADTLQGLELISDQLDVAFVEPPGTWGGRPIKQPTYEGIVKSMQQEILGLQRPVVLLGHSFGAVYAASLMLSRELSVRAFISLAGVLTRATAADLEKNYKDKMTPALSAAEKNFDKAPTEQNFRNWFLEYGSLFFLPRTQAKAQRLLQQSQMSPETFVAIRDRINPDELMEKELTATEIPKLLIAGEQDGLVKGHRLEDDAKLLKGDFALVSDAGHFLSIDQPEDTSSKVIEFTIKSLTRRTP